LSPRPFRAAAAHVGRGGGCSFNSRFAAATAHHGPRLDGQAETVSSRHHHRTLDRGAPRRTSRPGDPRLCRRGRSAWRRPARRTRGAPCLWHPSLLAEGRARVITSFIGEGPADRLVVGIAPRILGVESRPSAISAAHASPKASVEQPVGASGGRRRARRGRRRALSRHRCSGRSSCGTARASSAGDIALAKTVRRIVVPGLNDPLSAVRRATPRGLSRVGPREQLGRRASVETVRFVRDVLGPLSSTRVPMRCRRGRRIRRSSSVRPNDPTTTVRLRPVPKSPRIGRDRTSGCTSRPDGTSTG
jgi:hypothetical protein